MKKKQSFSKLKKSAVVVSAVLFGLLHSAHWAHAQSQASTDVSTLPLALSVEAGSAASDASAAAGASVATAATIPVALSVDGAKLTVQAVKASATGTTYVLERVSDGAVASVTVAAKVAGGASHAVGTVVETTLVSAGVLLSVAGEVLAFIPNEMGKALMHDERIDK